MERSKRLSESQQAQRKIWELYNKEQLIKVAQPLTKSGYGNYLLDLAKQAD